MGNHGGMISRGENFWLVHQGSLVILSAESSTSKVGQTGEGSDEFGLFFSWRWGGSSTQAWMPTYISILRIPQIIWVWRVTVVWYVDRRKPKNSEKNLSQCHFVHHKSHMDWPGCEPGPPRWEAGD
jgi:hypothetical protein